MINISVDRIFKGGTNVNNNIAEYVNKLKKEGKSITEIVQAIGIGRSSFYDIMSGNQIPKLDTANKIAIALNVDIKELFPDLKEEWLMNIQIKSINEKPHISINSKEFSLTNGFSVHLALEELRLLNTGLEIRFESLGQFNELIKEINKL